MADLFGMGAERERFIEELTSATNAAEYLRTLDKMASPYLRMMTPKEQRVCVETVAALRAGGVN